MHNRPHHNSPPHHHPPHYPPPHHPPPHHHHPHPHILPHFHIHPNIHIQPHHETAIIRNPISGLVLDASQYEVRLQHYTGFPSQLWSTEPIGNGKYYIVNRGNGRVLDVKDGVISGASVITFDRHGGENQQWFINSDNTIVSSIGNLALDIYQSSYMSGNIIVAYPKHGGANQIFYFEPRQ